VPKEELPTLLREGEDAIINEIKGLNPLGLQACLRLMCKVVVAERRIPKFSDMPPEIQGAALYLSRLRRVCNRAVTPEQFALLADRLEVLAHEIGGRQVALRPITIVVFEQDAELERGRRALLYARQWELIEELYDEHAELRQGPAAQAVICDELNREFPSARQAASYMREVMGKSKVRRSDIRTAIRRGCKCAGMRWRYKSGDSQIIRNGCERPVRCRDLDVPFASLTDAAAFAGISTTTMSLVLNGDGQWDGHVYEWAELQQTVPRLPTQDEAFSEMFPLFAGV
jgi:hypothetical protein